MEDSALKPIMIVGTSAEHRRQCAIAHFGSQYELCFISPDIDEKQYRADNALELTKGIAHAKMHAVLKCVDNDEELWDAVSDRDGSVAVCFDQVVVWNNEIREKPISVEQGIKFITSYSNSQLDTVQTTVMYNFTLDEWKYRHNTTTTYYRSIPSDVIERVAHRKSSRRAAGGFAVEDEEMLKYMIKIEPGTMEEVQGFCARVIDDMLTEYAKPAAIIKSSD